MHDEIIRYHLDGEILDGDIVASRERMVEFVETQMRDSGCVPSLDLEPQFTLDYQPERGVFRFELTVYGVYAKGDNVWNTAGVMNGKTITKHTHLIK